MFLYPALDIKRGGSVTPIETYVSWKDHYAKEDGMFICLYHLRDDVEFRQFEKTKLLGNKMFHDFRQVDGNRGVYVFNYTDQKHNWDCFLRGRYSQMTPEHKKRIQEYMGRNNGDAPYIESFLYPEKYYRMYAEIMHVKEELLREVGELCSKPNLESETLEISVINLQIKEQIS